MQISVSSRSRPSMNLDQAPYTLAPRFKRTASSIPWRPFSLLPAERPRRDVSLSARVTEVLPVYGVLTAAIGALGFGGWKVYLYFQLEYITAAMIGNHVPKGGARVLQIGGGTRELYYYPKGTLQVSVTQSSTKKENGGVAAKIPVVVRESPDLRSDLRSFNFGSDGYYDAIILLEKFSNIKDRNAFLKEVAAALKPAGNFIFIEKEEAILKLVEGNAMFEDVQSDVALEGQDPHIVGVAKKQSPKQKPKERTKTGFASD